MRRGRVTTDRVICSSENPVAWGVITEINGDSITLHAPHIDGARQVVNRPFHSSNRHHASTRINYRPPEKTLTVGNLIHVYNARPQTIIVNGGL